VATKERKRKRLNNSIHGVPASLSLILARFRFFYRGHGEEFPQKKGVRGKRRETARVFYVGLFFAWTESIVF
jgi:hypothetical protein